MKNKKALFLVITSLIMLLVNCKKEETYLKTNEHANAQSNEIKVVDGMLHFENTKSLIKTNELLRAMSPEQRLEWSRKYNLKTQLIILDELDKAQTAFEDKKYKGLDENITLEAMQNLNFEPEWCPEIKEYESSGMLKTKVEKDGSISFEVLNERHSVLGVVNEQGFVLVGDNIFLYSGEKIKLKKYTSEANKTELLNTQISGNNENDVQIIDFSSAELKLNERETIIGNIFNQNSNNWIWYYNSSTERFNHYVRMYSYEYWTYSHVYPFTWSNTYFNQFTTVATGEKRRFGIWKRRSNYKPVWRIKGSWDWQMWPLNTKPSISAAGHSSVSSPFNTGITSLNYKSITMWPTGIHYHHHSGDYIEYLGLSIRGYFTGGSSGYSTHYYN